MDETNLDHFQSIAWCAALISDQAFKLGPNFSRQPKASTEDSLIAETLKTTNTISHCLTIYKPPPPPAVFIDEVHMLMTLGSGMNGGPNLLHGGIISTLMDDAMGALLTLNKEHQGIPLYSQTHATVTATLDIKYLKPIPTPKTVLVSVSCVESTEKKFRFEAKISDEKGVDLATAKALWIRFDRTKLKL